MKKGVWFDEKLHMAEDIVFGMRCFHSGLFCLRDVFFSHEKKNWASGGATYMVNKTVTERDVVASDVIIEEESDAGLGEVKLQEKECATLRDLDALPSALASLTLGDKRFVLHNGKTGEVWFHPAKDVDGRQGRCIMRLGVDPGIHWQFSSQSQVAALGDCWMLTFSGKNVYEIRSRDRVPLAMPLPQLESNVLAAVLDQRHGRTHSCYFLSMQNGREKMIDRRSRICEGRGTIQFGEQSSVGSHKRSSQFVDLQTYGEWSLAVLHSSAGSGLLRLFDIRKPGRALKTVTEKELQDAGGYLRLDRCDPRMQVLGTNLLLTYRQPARPGRAGILLTAEDGTKHKQSEIMHFSGEPFMCSPRLRNTPVEIIDVVLKRSESVIRVWTPGSTTVAQRIRVEGHYFDGKLELHTLRGVGPPSTIYTTAQDVTPGVSGGTIRLRSHVIEFPKSL